MWPEGLLGKVYLVENDRVGYLIKVSFIPCKALWDAVIMCISSFMLWSQDELKTFLKAAGCKLVVVEFSAKWCGPCQKIYPLVHVSITCVYFPVLEGILNPLIIFSILKVCTYEPYGIIVFWSVLIILMIIYQDLIRSLVHTTEDSYYLSMDNSARSTKMCKRH